MIAAFASASPIASWLSKSVRANFNCSRCESFNASSEMSANVRPMLKAYDLRRRLSSLRETNNFLYSGACSNFWRKIENPVRGTGD